MGDVEHGFAHDRLVHLGGTDLPLDEIARLEAMDGAEINEAKKVLANEATAMCRGRFLPRSSRFSRAS